VFELLERSGAAQYAIAAPFWLSAKFFVWLVLTDSAKILSIQGEDGERGHCQVSWLLANLVFAIIVFSIDQI